MLTASYWRNFGSGAYSVWVGLERGASTLGAATGLRGDAAHQNYWQNRARVGKFNDKYANDPCFRAEVNNALKKAFKELDKELGVNGDLRGYVAGRVLTGTLTYTGPFAIAGDTGYYVEQGMSMDQSIIEGMIGVSP